MKNLMMALGAIVLATATAAALAGPPQGQGRGGRGGAPPCANLACDVQNDWTRNMTLLTRTAEAMPEDKWNYKSTDPQRTFGQQVMHIVQIDSKLFAALGGKTPPPQINMSASSKADVLAALRQSLEYGQAVIKEFDDAGLLERVNGLFLGPSASRVRIINFSMSHSQDVYGQLVVYLRLNGVVPPASNPA